MPMKKTPATMPAMRGISMLLVVWMEPEEGELDAWDCDEVVRGEGVDDEDALVDVCETADVAELDDDEDDTQELLLPITSN